MITKTCEFVEVTDLVPTQWESWFWSLISDSAPFSWGDNNRTLVTADRFLEHCCGRLGDLKAEDFIDEEDESFETYETDKAAFLAALEELEDTYIDLEN